MVNAEPTTVEEKLRSLYRLQLVDSRLDEIERYRGALPIEVENLEKEIVIISNEISIKKQEIASFEGYINEKKNEIKESEDLLEKYRKQQDNVRNSREFDSLNSEIEFQELHIESCERKIRKVEAEIEQRNAALADIGQRLNLKEERLTGKRQKLEIILKETAEKEKAIKAVLEGIRVGIDDYLLDKYDKIRAYSSNDNGNGLAVVTVENDAAVGSFFVLTPQLRLDINARKRIVTDPYSGRILVDPALASEEKEKVQQELS